MMTPDQLDNWFRYHAPTDETRPKYAAIRVAEEAAHVAIAHVKAGRAWDGDANGIVTPDTKADFQRLAYAYVNQTCRAFAVVIDQSAPDSADKSAAIRCVRLARNCVNEGVALGLAADVFCWTQAQEQLRLARFQANSAIACGGK